MKQRTELILEWERRLDEQEGGGPGSSNAGSRNAQRGLAPRNNLLVQLPDAAYRALAADWDLPLID